MLTSTIESLSASGDARQFADRDSGPAARAQDRRLRSQARRRRVAAAIAQELADLAIPVFVDEPVLDAYDGLDAGDLFAGDIDLPYPDPWGYLFAEPTPADVVDAWLDYEAGQPDPIPGPSPYGDVFDPADLGWGFTVSTRPCGSVGR